MEAAKNAFNHVMGYNKESVPEHHHHVPGHHKNDEPPTTCDDTSVSSTETPSKPVSAGNSDNNDQQGSSQDLGRVQSPKQGPDPALVGDPNPTDKMTGTAVPGSHSAVFGLTPDGKKVGNTSPGSSAPKPAHSSKTAVGGGREEAGDLDTSSRTPASGEVSEQMHKAEADPGAKGLQRTDPAPEPAGSDGKPGAGVTGMQQGSGKVEPGK
ncbi:uncharacterized protein Z519_08287 [Cladophialophora bantiana CBS 173.52]|uniref:Uncharacterized protein n=1 Tax=Cladophialophora bantiana (strain ATCC 10958 / CBS 173.52 / CDC B-1940 / NIH 8579) TaxID=1442370 RepID=A0A0D2EN08_CLAB1|nr:uncharacterized protein Z519_08287 [Cladophialophora bantiana CBS 173.52]KIW91391.1 hypothetical protein Z519_08287 [Cladophialophora bantiana CBS 173.52]